MKNYLAVDIGASSGRVMLSHLENGKIVLEELHRFANGLEKKDGHLVWNTDQLFQEILTGMKKCGAKGIVPESIGVDTWAVDFVLLDEEDNRLGDAVGYRDSRTQGMDEKVYEVIGEEALYGRTGIQKQPFNTIYQLMALKEQNKALLEQAKTLLLLPDYFHFLLTGKKAAEYTNATTTQLVDPQTKTWDDELIAKLGYPRELFQELILPGTPVGTLSEEIAKEVGFSCQVIAPATHDTASAVMAVPSTKEDVVYISSGTWSLMGTELFTANCTMESRRLNFTNEGGYDYRFRFLKNIMGLWMINSARKELAPEESFGAICDAAAKETISSIVDANDPRFMAPESMVEEIQKACAETGQAVPEGMAQVAAVIYHSLATCYAKTVQEISQMTGKQYDCIHIIGGGANAAYLNELTAKACQCLVIAGPNEATAIGNVIAQMIASKELKDLAQARICVANSFALQEYQG